MPVALGVGVPFKSKFSGTVVDPGLALLQSAVLWLDASNPGADSQKVANRGTGGTALDARYGSTTGVDTNDPLLLTHTGTNYLYLPGIIGNSATSPDSVPLSITGDIDIQVRVAPIDWTPLAAGVFCGKWHSSDTAQQGYAFFLDTTGKLRWVKYTGGVYEDLLSTVATPFTDGQAGWVRITKQQSSGTVKFYTSTDATSPTWSQLGTNVAGNTTIQNDTANVFAIGSTTNGTDFVVGNYYRIIVRNGYDGAGSVVFDADFTTNTNQSSFTESSSNAATVTINRATSGRKAVMVVRPTLLFGTDDYLEIADNDLLDIAASDNFSVIFVGRAWNTPTSGGRLFSKKASSSAGAGWEAFFTTGTFLITNRFADGTNASNLSTATPTTGQYFQLGWVRDVTADTVNQYLGSTLSASTTDTTTTTAAEANVLRIGSSVGSVYQDMEVTQFAVFRSALTSVELGQIATYLGV